MPSLSMCMIRLGLEDRLFNKNQVSEITASQVKSGYAALMNCFLAH